MNLEPAIPLLRIFDVSLARAFYLDWLGFEQDWEQRYAPGLPSYRQISRGKCVLHLTEHYGDCTPGGKVFIHTSDVNALHQVLKSRPNPFSNPAPCNAPWGDRILEIIDPFGNKLLFNQSGAKAS